MTETAAAPPKKKKRRKKGDLLPNTRTIRECERRGWTAGAVDQRIPYKFITIDFLNCIDIIACHPSIGIVGIQATGEAPTSGGHHTAREAKIEAEPRAVTWLASGGRIEVWSWALRGDAGAKNWRLRRTRAFLSDGRIGWAPVEDDIVPPTVPI